MSLRVRRGEASLGDPESSKGNLTGAGCVVVFLSVIVIFAVALPIVHWRDPNTGKPLPRMVAICLPVIIGACFNAAVGFVLRLIGIRSWKPAPCEDRLISGDTQTSPAEPQDKWRDLKDED